jgi:hypothetical protein
VQFNELLPRHEDVDLHNELTAQERVDAVLDAPHLTTEQAVAALDCQYRENQSTFPHVVIAKVMVSATPRGERDIEHRSYYGPFRNRRESETWAEQRFATIDGVIWEVAPILTTEMDAQQREQMRRILEGD